MYEFRSERLIKGILDRKGNFIPDLGSAVIEYKEYRGGKGVPRIYNLPREYFPLREFPGPGYDMGPGFPKILVPYDPGLDR